MRVHRGHADVEAGQEVRWPVDAAIGRDVELGAVQQRQAAASSLQPAGRQVPDLLALGEHLVVGHPLHDQIGRVVGDGVVLVAAGLAAVTISLERGRAVGQVRVRVQVTANVGLADQHRAARRGARR